MIKMTVNQTDLKKILAAIDRVGLVVASLAKSITEESAREFADLLRTNITTQKYGDFGKPHGKWKKGLESAYWLWLGTLLKSIAPWKVQESVQLVQWFAGLKWAGGSSGGGRVPKRSIPKKVVVNKKRLNLIKKAVAKNKGLRPLSPEQLARIGKPSVSKKKAGTQLGGGKVISLGKAGKKQIILQRN